MTDFRIILANLRRPRLLIRAARFGLEDYRRDRDLSRLARRFHGNPVGYPVAVFILALTLDR